MDTNWFLVWALATLPGYANFFGCVGGFLFLVGGIGTLAYLWGDPEGDYDERDARRFGLKTRGFLPWGAGLILIAMLVPSTNDLVRAYVLVEGSEIVNAENAEAASKALLERVDKLIEAIRK